MDVEYTHRLTIDIDIGPHGAVVGLLKEDGLGTRYRIAAVDCHVLPSNNQVGEIFTVYVTHLFVATYIGVFLDAEDIHILSFHLGEHVLGNEARGSTSETGDIIWCHFDTRTCRVFGMEDSWLVDSANIGYAAQYDYEW